MDYTQIDYYLKRLEKICRLKGLSHKTLKSYSYATKRFLKFTFKNELNLNNRAVRYYLLTREISINSSRLEYAAIKFFFREILKKPFTAEEVPNKKKIKQLPKVLSQEKIKQIIESTKNLKHKLIIKFLYSSGLRLNELINLKRKDINFDRNIIFVNQGKGKKDRITLLSENLKLDLLKYYSRYNPKTEYVFEGTKGKYSPRSVQEILRKIGEKSHIKLYPHMLRHSFATHLLEQGVNIRYIQKLLGHSNVKTTQIYTKVSRSELEKIKNPLDFISE